MIVVLVAPEIPDYALEYAHVLAETCDVVLFIPSKFRRIELANSPRLEIRWTDWPRQRNFENLWFVTKLARQIRRLRPDVVHCLDSNNVWLNLLPLFLRSIPFATTLHDVCVHPGDRYTQRVPRIFVRVLAKQSTAVVVHGEGLRSHAITNLKTDPARTLVFPHPPLTRYRDLASQAGFSKPDDHLFRILFFGRVQKYKGLRYLIEAAFAVRTRMPNAMFVIAGQGNFSDYRDLIADSDCFEIYNRFIPEVDAARLFAEADLLALPYIEASQSGVLLLAMPFGLPVVATDVGEMGRTVESTGMGFVIPSRDPTALTSAIIRAASDPNSLAAFRKNMQKLMQGDLSRPTLSIRALKMYKRILELDSSDFDPTNLN